MTDWRWGMMHNSMDASWAGGFIVLLFWILVIVCVVAWVRHSAGNGEHHMHGRSDALEILKSRYAKGEIDKKEFEEKKKDLTA